MRAGYGWFSFRLNEVLKYQIKDRNEIFWINFYSHVYNIFWLKFKHSGNTERFAWRFAEIF